MDYVLFALVVIFS